MTTPPNDGSTLPSVQVGENATGVNKPVTYCHALCGCPEHFPDLPKNRRLEELEAEVARLRKCLEWVNSVALDHGPPKRNQWTSMGAYGVAQVTTRVLNGGEMWEDA